MTDGNYFLQVGFKFHDGIGEVVWAADQIDKNFFGIPIGSDLQAKPLNIPYIPYHDYYTTIAYTNGVWWTCAADMQDTTTYRCEAHLGAKGTHLISHFGTSVFAENWNKNADWSIGFSAPWVAHGARTYRLGQAQPQLWSKEIAYTLHAFDAGACFVVWPRDNAISYGLVNDDDAFFWPAGLPTYCG